MRQKKDGNPVWYSEYLERDGMSKEDQKYVWDMLNEMYGLDDNGEPVDVKENVGVNGNVNGTYKNEVKSDLNWPKIELIHQLTKCTIITPESKIATLLEQIFSSWPSDGGHWSYLAQTYTPRVINWVMSSTVKTYKRGGVKKNPAAHFTHCIKFRTKRKKLVSTNDAHNKSYETKRANN